jgi:hypothetical protein
MKPPSGRILDLRGNNRASDRRRPNDSGRKPNIVGGGITASAGMASSASHATTVSHVLPGVGKSVVGAGQSNPGLLLSDTPLQRMWSGQVGPAAI